MNAFIKNVQKNSHFFTLLRKSERQILKKEEFNKVLKEIQ